MDKIVEIEPTELHPTLAESVGVWLAHSGHILELAEPEVIEKKVFMSQAGAMLIRGGRNDLTSLTRRAGLIHEYEAAQLWGKDLQREYLYTKAAEYLDAAIPRDAVHLDETV